MSFFDKYFYAYFLIIISAITSVNKFITTETGGNNNLNNPKSYSNTLKIFLAFVDIEYEGG